MTSKTLKIITTIILTTLFGLIYYFAEDFFYTENDFACGCSSTCRSYFPTFPSRLVGDFAKEDSETINLDSLKAGKCKGKLLGFLLEGNDLTVFRIGENPLKVKTSFLFWKINNDELLKDFAYGLNTYRNVEAEKTKGHYEFIGGQEMSEKNFLDEFILTEKSLLDKKLKN